MTTGPNQIKFAQNSREMIADSTNRIIFHSKWDKWSYIHPNAHCSIIKNFQEFEKHAALDTLRRRPGKLMKGVLFHQNNAPAHKSVVAMAAVHDVALNPGGGGGGALTCIGGTGTCPVDDPLFQTPIAALKIPDFQ